MERKKALAVAATITCVLGSTAVAAASVGGTSILGFGGASDVRFASVARAENVAQSTNIVRRTKNVYDEVVVGSSPSSERAKTAVPTTVSAPASSSVIAAPSSTSEPAPESGGSQGSGGEVHRRRAARPTEEGPKPTEGTRVTAPETTEPPPTEVEDPTTTTTSAPVTTTTRPPGVPKDWPPDKPIPPMPPNCHHPQLEDNGVWNCEDD